MNIPLIYNGPPPEHVCTCRWNQFVGGLRYCPNEGCEAIICDCTAEEHQCSVDASNEAG